MKKHVLFLLLAVPMLLGSCASSKFYSQKAEDIRPIALVESYSYITDAVFDFTTDYLPDASRFNQLLINDIMNSSGMPIQKTVSVDFDAANPDSQLGAWMMGMLDLSTSRAKNLIIPAEIRDAVRQSGCRYGLLISDVGYSKNAKQYALEEGLDIAMKISDIIFYNSIDLSKDAEAYTNGIWALVFDNQTGRVVWFGKQPRRYEYDPLDKKSLTEQLNKLFKGFR